MLIQWNNPQQRVETSPLNSYFRTLKQFKLFDMRTTLLSVIFAFAVSLANAQGCNEIFISEYIEGWSNNKAVEIYNPTNNAVDLSGYRLERYSNGATSAANNQKLDLVGIMPALSVYVVVLDKRDPDGTGQEAPVWDELQEKADVFLCPLYDTNNALYFNGNDALVLRKITGNVVVDVFGKIGQDPGNPSDGGGWNNGPEFTWTANLETAWSTDHTLIRKATVTAGDVNPIDAFDISVQWDSTLANTFENLGSHICDCGSVINSVSEVAGFEIGVYPNPSENGLVTVKSPATLSRYRVLTLDGRVVAENAVNLMSFELNLNGNPAGLYTIQVWDENGVMSRSRLLLK